ncbi:transporter [Paraburkholderia ginsengiterrae]|uniref:Transporter n=1 Tax=Paraburkholderia ginsengiterrae TaxID=1462993 RepID=A0A1A9NES7_9BURK|nr:BON domain-containing protein [Paraburkholderia ginsengiterrae]OAJ62145.1 transporter [Paraburkholderia ginsengiterrae]OAJ65492.1 transporter [Paraburkholderia ginsengiterrae]
MNNLRVLSIAVGVLLAAASVSAWAQGGGTASGSAAPALTAASGVPTGKAARQANRALSRKVYAALAKHKEIEAGNISVVARDGAVTLNGTVTEASQIDTVAAIAKGVPGVTSVANRLSVQRPLGE